MIGYQVPSAPGSRTGMPSELPEAWPISWAITKASVTAFSLIPWPVLPTGSVNQSGLSW
ncbi:hypothetical protein [Azospirillum sp. A23]|uniref:hypothetical protein n=1 Tax=Azospirillum sp. A23 TaxID=3160608 RepID=UPI0036F3FB0E